MDFKIDNLWDSDLPQGIKCSECDWRYNEYTDGFNELFDDIDEKNVDMFEDMQ